MKFLNANKVLCLSAHPDDAEYGALGSIMKFNETQFDVLVLSGGGDFDDTTGYSRLEECQSIWSEIPNLNGSFVKNGFIKDKTEDGWVNYIETLARSHFPWILYGQRDLKTSAASILRASPQIHHEPGHNAQKLSSRVSNGGHSEYTKINNKLN